MGKGGVQQCERERERECVFRFVGKNRCDGGRIKIIKENFKKI